MNICFTYDHLYPASSRAGRHVETLARRFVQRGHRVFAISTPVENAIEPDDVTLLRLREAPGAKGHNRSDALLQKAIVKFLRQHDVQIVFAEGITPLSAIATKAARAADARTIIRVLADAGGIVYSIGHDRKVPPSLLKKRIAVMLEDADAAAASSERCAQLLKELYDGEIVVIEKCVDLAIFRHTRVTERDLELFRERIGLGNRPVIVYGREEMRAETILSTIGVMRHLAREKPEICYLIVGQIDDQEAVRAGLEAAGLAENYRLVGGLSQRDFFAAYACASLYFAPIDSRASESELLEAMAMRVAMVCSAPKAQSAPSIIFPDRNALVFDAADEEAAARQIAALLVDGERLRGMRDAALEVARTKDMATAVEQVESLCVHMLGLPLETKTTAGARDAEGGDDAPVAKTEEGAGRPPAPKGAEFMNDADDDRDLDEARGDERDDEGEGDADRRDESVEPDERDDDDRDETDEGEAPGDRGDDRGQPGQSNQRAAPARGEPRARDGRRDDAEPRRAQDAPRESAPSGGRDLEPVSGDEPKEGEGDDADQRERRGRRGRRRRGRGRLRHETDEVLGGGADAAPRAEGQEDDDRDDDRRDDEEDDAPVARRPAVRQDDRRPEPVEEEPADDEREDDELGDDVDEIDDRDEPVRRDRGPESGEDQRTKDEALLVEARQRLRDLDPKLTLKDLMPFLRPPKDVVIMSLASASGHHRAGEALFEAFKNLDQNLRVRQVNILDYISRSYTASEVDAVLDELYHNPAIFGNQFETGAPSAPESADPGRADFFKNVFGEKLKQFLTEKRPHQVILTHFLPVKHICDLKRDLNLKMRVSVVVTDYDFHPHWLGDGVDQYLVPTEKVRFKMIRAGAPATNVEVAGVPVHPRFESQVDAENVRRQLGIRPGTPTILLRPGGIGPTEAILEVIRQISGVGQPFNLMVLAGKNENLMEAIRALQPPRGVAVKPFGFVNNIHEIMAVSDLMITRATGHTVAEAYAAGLPMVLLRPTPGIEERTADWFVERGVAIQAHDSLDLEWIMNDLLKNQARAMKAMREAMTAGGRPKAGAAALAADRITKSLH